MAAATPPDLADSLLSLARYAGSGRGQGLGSSMPPALITSVEPTGSQPPGNSHLSIPRQGGGVSDT